MATCFKTSKHTNKIPSSSARNEELDSVLLRRWEFGEREKAATNNTTIIWLSALMCNACSIFLMTHAVLKAIQKKKFAK